MATNCTNWGQRTFLIFPERHMPRRSAAAISASPSLRIALAINFSAFAAEKDNSLKASGAVMQRSGLMSGLNRPKVTIVYWIWGKEDRDIYLSGGQFQSFHLSSRLISLWLSFCSATFQSFQTLPSETYSKGKMSEWKSVRDRVPWSSEGNFHVSRILETSKQAPVC